MSWFNNNDNNDNKSNSSNSSNNIDWDAYDQLNNKILRIVAL